MRTAAGQAEIQARTLPLSRPVRNLLLILTPDQPGEHWVAQVRGCTGDDLQRLLSEGLVAQAAPAAAPARAVAEPPAAPEAEVGQLQARIRALSYAPLYDALNSHGKETLGLVGGYRFALEVERCNGPAELKALALRYVGQLLDKHGLNAVRSLAARLPQ